MKNILINQSNHYDQKTREFFNTNLAERLAKKYAEKTYQERFRSVYTVAWVFTFLCNSVSILTASSFVFSYIIAIVYLLPHPHIISGVVTGIVLVTIESLQRLLAPRFFQNLLQYNKKNLFPALLLLSGLSITFSYLGSPDFLETVSETPVYEKPEKIDIATIRSDYKEQIKDAKAEAEEYKKRKLWGGRLSDDNAKVYEKLLGKVALLREQMNADVREFEQTNISLTEKAKDEFVKKENEFKQEIESQGFGLGIISIIAQILFFLCVWYTEYYDFRVASQYAILQGSTPSQSLATEPTIETYIQQSTTPRVQKEIEDLYTIEHKSFRDGSMKRYNLQQLNGIVSVYENRLAEAIEHDDTIKILSREESLNYWGGLRKSLLHKMQHPQLERTV